MPGWIPRAEALLASGASRGRRGAQRNTRSVRQRPSPDGLSAVRAILRHEGDYWTVAYAGATGRLKDMKGLHYLVHLLEHPGNEFHVLDLLGQTTSAALDEPGNLRGAVRAADLPLLDATAKASIAACRPSCATTEGGGTFTTTPDAPSKRARRSRR